MSVWRHLSQPHISPQEWAKTNREAPRSGRADKCNLLLQHASLVVAVTSCAWNENSIVQSNCLNWKQRPTKNSERYEWSYFVGMPDMILGNSCHDTLQDRPSHIVRTQAFGCFLHLSLFPAFERSPLQIFGFVPDSRAGSWNLIFWVSMILETMCRSFRYAFLGAVNDVTQYASANCANEVQNNILLCSVVLKETTKLLKGQELKPSKWSIRCRWFRLIT